MRRILVCAAAGALAALTAAGCQRAATRPAEPAWVFAVVADNRGGNPFHRQVMQSIKADGAEMILNAGDMVHPSEGCHWHDFLADMRAVYGDQVPRVLQNYFVTAGGWEEQYVNRARRANDPPVAKEDWHYAGKHEWVGYEPDNAAGQCFYGTYFRYRERTAERHSGLVDYDLYGDYHVKYRNLHVLCLYISDEWHRPEQFDPSDDPAARARAWERQVEWVAARLALVRRVDPGAPVVVIAQDDGWFAQAGEGFLGRLGRLLAKYRVDLALCGDGHVYRLYPDAVTLKLMVPACLEAGKSGYLRVGLDGPTITVEHCDETGRMLHAFAKPIGGPTGLAAKP